jgi:hypothetical protein
MKHLPTVALLALLTSSLPAQDPGGQQVSSTLSGGRSTSLEDSFPPAAPASQGVSAGALARLSELITGFVEADEIVGAELLIIKNRRTVMHEVFGHNDRIRGRLLEKNTISWIVLRQRLEQEDGRLFLSRQQQLLGTL